MPAAASSASAAICAEVPRKGNLHSQELTGCPGVFFARDSAYYQARFW